MAEHKLIGPRQSESQMVEIRGADMGGPVCPSPFAQYPPLSLTWDGRNAAGLRAPSGMYLVRMTATSASGSHWTSMGTLNLMR